MRKVMRVVNRAQCIGCYSCMYACSRTYFHIATTKLAALRVKNYAGVEGAFSIRICIGCTYPDCAAACPTEALTIREGGGVTFHEEKCIHCYKCVEACTLNAMQWDPIAREPLVCHQCGICAEYCPNNVLALVEVEDDREAHND